MLRSCLSSSKYVAWSLCLRLLIRNEAPAGRHVAENKADMPLTSRHCRTGFKFRAVRPSTMAYAELRWLALYYGQRILFAVTLAPPYSQGRPSTLGYAEPLRTTRGFCSFTPSAEWPSRQSNCFSASRMSIRGRRLQSFPRSLEQDGTRVATPVGKIVLIAGCCNR